MDWEAFKKHKVFAGEKKPSMLRRRVGHDYEQRCVYLVTMTVEGRRPLLGRLVGNAGAESGSSDAPHIELSPLGKQVREMWEAISEYYPEVRVSWSGGSGTWQTTLGDWLSSANTQSSSP